MSAPLAGQLALVTGGSKGIGLAIAEALLAAGAAVVRVSRSPVESLGAHDHPVRADLATDDGLERLAASVAELGIPDLIVSNAGGFSLGALEETDVSVLDELYRVNLRAPYQLARRFLPAMRGRGRGRHLLIGSIADYRALAGNAAYGATKFGARGLHEVLREEYRGTGVLCTLVSPGATDTPLWDPVDPDRREDLPSRRQMLRPADVADAVLWVATRPPRVDIGVIQLGPA